MVLIHTDKLLGNRKKKFIIKRMREIIIIILMCIDYTVTCFAHWMPESEMFVGGVGFGCTMGYVQSIYGDPAEKKWFNNEGVRGVTYIYDSGFSVTGRTGSNNPQKESELIVVGYDLKTSGLSTSSGITVGVPYSTVAGMFGQGQKFQSKKSIAYSYKIAGTLKEIDFYVDHDGIITEIYCGTDW